MPCSSYVVMITKLIKLTIQYDPDSEQTCTSGRARVAGDHFLTRSWRRGLPFVGLVAAWECEPALNPSTMKLETAATQTKLTINSLTSDPLSKIPGQFSKPPSLQAFACLSKS